MATTVDTLLVRIEADMSDLRKDLAKVAQQTEQRTTQMADGFRKVRNAVVAIGGTALFTSFIKSTIDVGAQIENLEIQMVALLGSAEEGGKAFQNMRNFASRVPFSLRQIQQGAGGLAAASNNADELNELLQITGNIAAQFNIPFEEAAANVQRALSAGAGAADQFRDRGVLAFAGFKAGVSYNAKETAQILQDTFGTGGTADGAMDAFAETTQGAFSMLGDAFFEFQSVFAGSGLNDAVVLIVNSLEDLIRKSRNVAIVMGVVVKKLVEGLAVPLAVIRDNMDKLRIVFIAFLALKTVTTISSITIAMVKFARATIGAGIAMKALNAAGRKQIVFFAALGAALKMVGGKTFEELEQLMSDALVKAFNVLPTSLQESITDFGKTIEEAKNELDKLDQKDDESKLDNIVLGGGVVDTKAALEATKLIDKINGGVGSLSKELKELRTAAALGVDGAIEAIKRLEHQIKIETDPAFAALVDASVALGDSITSAFRQMLDGTKLTMADFRDMIRSTVADVIAQIFRLTVVNQVLNAIFPGLGLKTSTFGQIMGRAGGGPVTRGSPYLVGERGPELFVPQGAGSVVNAATTRGMSDQPVVVNQTFNVSTGVQQTVRAEIRSLMPQIADSAKAAVADAKRRGGSYGKAFA